MNVLQDSFGRTFPYLRLSVTEACNFRCLYCLPDGYRKTGQPQFLSVREIERLIGACVALGVQKVRLTGGEPTVRRDLTAIAAAVSCTPGIRTVGLTTNGYNLKEKAAEFFAAGVRALNVSVDSLDPSTFQAVTGHDKLGTVLAGIDAARRAGLRNIKINTVLLKGVNDASLPEFLRWIRREALCVRFIELMQTGDNLAYFRKHHLSAAVMQQRLLECGFSPRPRPRAHDAGPAVEFEHPDYAGSVGLIAPYSKDFCATCNRLRITARGSLMPCLFGAGGYDLRALLQRDEQQEELQNAMLRALRFKHAGHDLHRGVTGATLHLASLGG